VTFLRRIFFCAGINVLPSPKAEFPLKIRHDGAIFFTRRRYCKNPLTVLESAASSSLYDDACAPRQQQVTQLLDGWRGEDQGALEKLIPLGQPELHRLAGFDTLVSIPCAGTTSATPCVVIFPDQRRKSSGILLS
jgi:hypothetical protein